MFLTPALAFLAAASALAQGELPSSTYVKLEDEKSRDAAYQAGAVVVADYGEFQIAEVSREAVENGSLPDAAVQTDYDLILLHAEPIHTRSEAAEQMASRMSSDDDRPRLHLVQFVGPPKPEWVQQITAGGARIVSYIPNNAYLIYGTSTAAKHVRTAPASAKYVKWQAEYEAKYKLPDGLKSGDNGKSEAAPATQFYKIQMVDDPAHNGPTLDVLNRFKEEPIKSDDQSLGYRNLLVRLPGHAIQELILQPDVVSVRPYVVPKQRCERQNMIISGNIAGNGPSGSGYLTWLGLMGFSQSQFDSSNIIVDVTDSGVDNGTTSPNHFALHRLGAFTNSRVVYNRLLGTANSGSTIQGCDGHGNINAHIVMGYSDQSSGFPHEDASGFNYGLGVAPFAKVGSSVIFDPANYTDPDFEDLISRAYADGARLSTNSWGADTGGAYTDDSQRYDALVRDGQPTGSAVPAAGNQQTVLIFAAGNAGSGLNTVGSPGSGKNMITVGASENFQPFGGSDACLIGDTGADSLNDIINFSSRGPCDDGRQKPDIVAPGTHVSGGVFQNAATAAGNGAANACFDGTGVCGGVGSDFFPAGQQFYTASGGTSHSTPAVAGLCALIRQYFINQGWPIPSPAMTKAFLINSTRYMTGVSANDNLWSPHQGMGLADAGRMFDGVARIRSDQEGGNIFTATGQSRSVEGQVADNTKPFRVTLAWTDAPGNTAGNAYNNDLDLEVLVNGLLYRGNNFSGQFSVSGGTADPRNNMESVFLPAGVSGEFVVRVKASNINSDGIPSSGGALDQDYALVVYNGTGGAVSLPYVNSVVVVSESCKPANSATDPNETVEFDVTVKNEGSLDAPNVTLDVNASASVVPLTPSVAFGNLSAGASQTKRVKIRALGKAGDLVTVAGVLKENGSPAATPTLQSFRLCAASANTSAFSYTGPVVPIPDGVTAGTTVSLNVSGFVGLLADVNFRFDGAACSSADGATGVGLDHTWVGDLIVRLTSPSGKQVILMNRPGGGTFGSSGNNFCQTVLDDQSGGQSIQVITSGAAPYTGSFLPANSLSAFIGENPNGTWQLNLSDNFSQDTGNLRAFSLLFKSYACCESATTSKETSFVAAPTGWTLFGMNTPNFATGQFSLGDQALQSTVASDPSKFRATGWLADFGEWLPYTSIGSGNIVRAKFHVYAGGLPSPSQTNLIPSVRARLSNRFAVNSMLEVFNHSNLDPPMQAQYQELRPSTDLNAPSVYRVDLDPIDVPYLVSNAATEGVMRGFEAYAIDPTDSGFIGLAESSIGVYPLAWTPNTSPTIAIYNPTGGGATGSLAVQSAAELTSGTYMSGGGEGSFPILDPNAPTCVYSESPAGVTLSTQGIPSNRVGILTRDFNPGPTQTQYPRVSEGKQYHIRWHLTSDSSANVNAQIRLRSRSVKFGWSQKLEIGGAWGTGNTVLNANNSIAQQTLPGVGSQNPDKNDAENGGWYNMIMHTPLSVDIRPEFAPGTPIATRMPLLAGQPGPGVNESSRRNILLGIDLVDSLSGGVNAFLEQGKVTLDTIQVREFTLVND